VAKTDCWWERLGRWAIFVSRCRSQTRAGPLREKREFVLHVVHRAAVEWKRRRESQGIELTAPCRSAMAPRMILTSPSSYWRWLRRAGRGDRLPALCVEEWSHVIRTPIWHTLPMEHVVMWMGGRGGAQKCDLRDACKPRRSCRCWSTVTDYRSVLQAAVTLVQVLESH